MQRRRARLVSGAILTVLLGAGALVGSTPAEAHHRGGCENDEGSIPTGGDDLTIVDGGSLLYLGVDKGDRNAGTPSTTATAGACFEVGGIHGTASVDRGDIPAVIQVFPTIIKMDDGDAERGAVVEIHGAPGGNIYQTLPLPKCVGILTSTSC